MAVNWKTGRVALVFPDDPSRRGATYDVSHPLMVLNVPINGKTTPVVAEGSKDGFFYVLNAINGSQVPNFKINTQPTLDPSGQRIALNNALEHAADPDGCVVLRGDR